MIRLIVAHDNQRGIAKDGGLPWDIPEDQAYFAAQTKTHGGRMLVGAATQREIGEPLEGRTTYVLTHESKLGPGLQKIVNLEQFMQDNAQKDLWVIGGAAIYQQVLDGGWADEVYVTLIDARFGCTTFFPHIPEYLTLREQSEWHTYQDLRYTFQIYTRKT